MVTMCDVMVIMYDVSIKVTMYDTRHVTMIAHDVDHVFPVMPNPYSVH